MTPVTLNCPFFYFFFLSLPLLCPPVEHRRAGLHPPTLLHPPQTCWQCVPILKRSQFMKGRDTKALIDGFHGRQAQSLDWFHRWYCYWRCARRAGSVNRGRMHDWKTGNSKGFASVRSRRSDSDGRPRWPRAVMRSCQCETGWKCSRLEGGEEGEYHIMVNRLFAAIKRQPRSHRAILLRDGWMKEWDSYETIHTGPVEGRWAALAHVKARVASIAVSALAHHADTHSPQNVKNVFYRIFC